MTQALIFLSVILQMILMFGGGFCVLGLFIYGVITLIFDSVSMGLMAIGGAVVVAFVAQILHGLVMALSMALVDKEAKKY